MKTISKLMGRVTAVLEKRSAGIFLVIASVLGGIFAFTIMPLHGSDEIVHFPRAYHVQEGHIGVEHLGGYDYGAHVPTQIKQFNDGYREQVQSDRPDAAKLESLQSRYDTEKLTDERREPLAFTSASVYSAWAYAPQGLGIFIAKFLDLPLNWYVYLGRLFTLVTYIVITYFAIRLIPFGKVFLVVVALLPTSLTQAATLGMDGLVNGFSWLIIALTLAIFTGKVRITPRILALITFVSTYLATTKHVYLPVAMLPLFIPARLYPFAYKKVWVWRAVFAAILLGAGLWYLSATSPINEIMHHIQRPGLYIDEGDQLHHVFQHPLEFLRMIFTQPLPIWSAGTYAGMVGVMTNRTIFIPFVMVIVLLATLIITMLHKERPLIPKRDRLFVISGSLVTLVITFVLINLALYLSFTRVGHYRVEGLQGRYFLPLLPLVGVALHVAMPKLFLKIPNGLLYAIVASGSLAALVSALVVL